MVMPDSTMRKEVDWRYILTHYDEEKYTIPYFYDSQIWTFEKPYRVRVANIYDVSKFWLVFRYEELTVFQSFLSDYYNKYGHLYKIKAMKRGIYCVVFSDGAYYRGVVAEVPCPISQQCKAIVFLMDFGYISAVSEDDIYYLAEKFYGVPRFAVRAVISGIQPINTYQWPMDTIKMFTELVAEKIMFCVVKDVHPKYRTLYVHLAEVNQSIELQEFQDVGDKLIGEKLASVAIPQGMTGVKGKKLVPLTKYPYLFPSFNCIEKCRMPFTAYTMDILRHCKSSVILLQPYHMVNPSGS